MKIKEMQVGQTATVSGYAGKDPAYRHKLLRMGLIKRVEFKLIRKAPMGDPVEIELRGFNLTLRKDEADILDVELTR
jgi:ferrous iron transport protein A